MTGPTRTFLRDAVSYLTFWRAVFILILALGLYAAVIRFSQGLGASTHLADSFPWGLWIGFDVLVGVGLAAGGFATAATVHIFRLERYEPIARATVLTAFLGYLLVVVGLLFDLGRPYRIWHPLIMWNPHSVMFEVGWCVMLYTTVLALEFSPLVFERLGWKLPLRLVRAGFVPLVIAGVLLSTLHQSSLGTLFVIAPEKLHGLWYTPMLPVFFFISALAGGLSMTIFESFMSRRAFGKRLEFDLLEGLARVSVVILAVYTVWRLEDLAMHGNFGLIFQLTPEATMFWGEMALGALLPMVLFAIPKVRRNDAGLFLAATLTVLGFIVNRLNVAITGMARSSGTFYVPSWMELAVTATVVALGFALFGLAVKHLNVFPQEALRAEPLSAPHALGPSGATVVAPFGRTSPVGTLSRSALITLWSLLLVGTILVGSSMHRSQAEDRTSEVDAGFTGPGPGRLQSLDLPPVYAFPMSDESPGLVSFDHERHVDSRTPRCGLCHSRLFSLSSSGRPLQGEISYERIHEGDLCASCHDGRAACAVDGSCEACHRP